jgi:tetratricopeptide (TPR) repeat protein
VKFPSFPSLSSLQFPKEKIELLPRISGGILLATAVLLPLLVLPFGENFLLDSKTLFFLAAAILVVAVWTLWSFARKTIQITISPFMLPLAILLIGTLLSSFLNGAYPIIHLVGVGGVYIAAAALVFLAPSLLPQKISKSFPTLFITSSVLLALTSAAELFNAGPSVVFNALLHLGLPNSPLFSLSGSPLIALELILVAITGCIAMIFSDRKMSKPFFALAALVLIGGAVVNGRALAQQKFLTNILPPFGASWSIATDTLKSVKSTVIGVGPENYQQMYLRYKPAWVNTTPVWNLQFNQGSNLPLTLLVTHGLIGLIGWLILAGITIQQARKTTKETRPFAVMALAILVIQLLLPPNSVLFALQALVLVFWIVAEKARLQDAQIHAFTVLLVKSDAETKKVPKYAHMFVYLFSGVFALGVLFCAAQLSIYAYSQFLMFRAGAAAQQNSVLEVYKLQQRAIMASPHLDTYRRSYSNTNLIIAQILAQKQDLAADEKQQVLTLLNQAIDQAKAATTINPDNSLNWVLVARTYNNLVGVSEGADTLAGSAYTQALFLAPSDPQINLELGNLYLRLGQYPQAVIQLEKTAQLKPDWANAFYNLANAYKMNKQYEGAVQAYQKTLSLLPFGTETDKVKAELEELSNAAANSGTGTGAGSGAGGSAAPATVAPAPSPTPKPTPKPKPSPTSESGAAGTGTVNGASTEQKLTPAEAASASQQLR